MSKKIYDLYDAKSALSQLVERAAAGEEIILAKIAAWVEQYAMRSPAPMSSS